MSYKCEVINTFNVFVLDLKSRKIKINYEGYELWETNVNCVLLDNNNYLVLSKAGANVLALDEQKLRVIEMPG